MAEEWSYHRLCDVYREEKSTNSLTPLPADFHRSLQELISRLTAAASGNLDGLKELELARKQIRLLARLRRQKLMMRASMEQADADPEGMTSFESALYIRLRDIYKQEDEQLESLMHPLPSASMPVSAMPAGELEIANGSPSRLPRAAGRREPIGASLGNAEPGPALSMKKVKLLADIPEYRGAVGTVYGPYADGQSLELPQAEAEALLRGKMAEESA